MTFLGLYLIFLGVSGLFRDLQRYREQTDDNTRPMITSTTSHKLAEIIRDTWPGLYRPPVKTYNNQKTSKNEKVQQ